MIQRLCLGCWIALCAVSVAADDRPEFLIVVGAEGQPEYGSVFKEAADRWSQACEKLTAKHRVIGPSDSDREQLLSAIKDANQATSQPLWLVFIGHGTFDRANQAKLNLTGLDVSSPDLKQAFDKYSRPVVIVLCCSSSGPFIKELAGRDRVVVTATKSGSELNYSRFAEYLSRSIADLRFDLDHDEQISLLEAFLSASKQVEQFYQGEGRLTTEHALLDDNGDQLGTNATFYRGIRAVKSGKDSKGGKEKIQPDGHWARRLYLTPEPDSVKLSDEQIAQRDRLEGEIEKLRGLKGQLPEADYYSRLEALFMELASLYQAKSS